MTAGELPRDLGDSAGFTLIELIVALALFALISLAGIGLVETIVGVQQRTDGRTDRLAEVQRAMYLVTADFAQLTEGPVRDGEIISLFRGSSAGSYGVTYRFAEGALHRGVAGEERVLMGDVANLQWRFLKGRAWIDQPTSRDEPERPRAVELALELGRQGRGIHGPLRRVIELPSEP